jgi:ATP-dependent Lon protease
LLAEGSTAAVTPRRAETRGGRGPRPRPQGLPGAVARQVQREMDRLRRLPAGSPEAAQVRAYLHCLWSLPWSRTVGENTDLRNVERQLERDHLGLKRAKERIVEYLAVRKLKPDLPAPALCLVGPPGTGKTSLGAAVAQALNRPFVRITVSGTSEAGELGRHQPQSAGRAARQDRAGAARGGRVRSRVHHRRRRSTDRRGGLGVIEVLLDLLDPATSAHFVDHYLGLPVDLSHAVLLLCANHLDLVPDALQERLETIEVPGYSEDEKLEIASRFLVPRQLTDHGLGERDLAFQNGALRTMLRHYTLEAGVRGLSRQIATVCRKVARARATGDKRRHVVKETDLERYLGHRVYHLETVGKTDEVGAAFGLAWTPAGGELLTVEALKMPGSGRIMTTGQLGDVMKESVQAAHSYVRSRAAILEIDAEAFQAYDIHVHFPMGGVPKDGPSAGITIGLVIASVLSDRPDPSRHRDDGRGVAARQGAARRRHAREGARRLPRRHPHDAVPRSEPQGPERHPRGRARSARAGPGEHDGRSALDRAPPRDRADADGGRLRHRGGRRRRRRRPPMRRIVRGADEDDE